MNPGLGDEQAGGTALAKLREQPGPSREVLTSIGVNVRQHSREWDLFL